MEPCGGGMRAFYDSKVAKVGREVYLATARRLGFIESFAGGPHTGHLLGFKIAADNFAISADYCEGAIVQSFNCCFGHSVLQAYRLAAKSEPTIRNSEEREIGPGTLRYPPRVRRCFA